MGRSSGTAWRSGPAGDAGRCGQHCHGAWACACKCRGGVHQHNPNRSSHDTRSRQDPRAWRLHGPKGLIPRSPTDSSITTFALGCWLSDTLNLKGPASAEEMGPRLVGLTAMGAASRFWTSRLGLRLCGRAAGGAGGLQSSHAIPPAAAGSVTEGVCPVCRDARLSPSTSSHPPPLPPVPAASCARCPCARCPCALAPPNPPHPTAPCPSWQSRCPGPRPACRRRPRRPAGRSCRRVTWRWRSAG